MKFPINLKEYQQFEIEKYDASLRTVGEQFWIRQGERKALELFHKAAEQVPAYKDFLKRNRVNPKKIKNIKDFNLIPVTDKKNYINAYTIAERNWFGKMTKNKIVAMSSGTGGEPRFWPRTESQEWEAAVVHELIYKNSFQIDKLKTLLLIGFPMGVYVSGIATTLPSWIVAQKGYPLTVVSVGNNKKDMLRLIQNVGDQYEQIILIGHPFFIKDVLETGSSEKIAWKKYKLRLMLCSEGFNEEWRNHILELIHSKDPSDVISVYGSSELLLMAYETKQSIHIRRKLSTQPLALKQVFSKDTLPNLFQYNPSLRYIESVNEELVYTSSSGLPLIRFNMHDQGVIIKYSELAKYNKVKNSNAWQLPYVALWGRSDNTLIFYAANIYPEHIHAALQHRSLIKQLTGKFLMQKGDLKNLDEYLEINVELNQGVRPTQALQKIVQNRIVQTLAQHNMEYRFLQSNLEKNLVPRIKLHEYQSEKYFKPGLKPKYVNK